MPLTIIKSDQKKITVSSSTHTNIGKLNISFGVKNYLPEYTGDYTVTPKVEAQTLKTAGKCMTEDLRIKAIPYYNVSNMAGGKTIYIGEEV